MFDTCVFATSLLRPAGDSGIGENIFCVRVLEFGVPGNLRLVLKRIDRLDAVFIVVVSAVRRITVLVRKFGYKLCLFFNNLLPLNLSEEVVGVLADILFQCCVRVSCNCSFKIFCRISVILFGFRAPVLFFIVTVSGFL